MSNPEIHRTAVHTEGPPAAPPVVTGPAVARPVAPGPVVDNRGIIVQDEVVTTPAVRERVSSSTRFTPARVITAIGGIVLLVIGLIALARGGLDGPLDEPVVQVAGMNHTPLLGLIGAGAGLLLLISALFFTDSGSRSASIFFGTLLGIGGIVAIATPESFESLALESSYGWLCLIIGAVVVLANLLLPSITDRKVVYR